MVNWHSLETVFLDMDGTLLDLHFDNHFWLEFLPQRYAELHGISPAMARRGRVQSGAVADITVFDPTTIIDTSTIADPAREAEGVRHVLVGGRPVRTDGVNDQGVRPGVAILSELT